MKIKTLYIALTTLLITLFIGGCTSPGLYKEGWSGSQKDELLHILKTDKYASMCGLETTYKLYLKTEDPKLLTKLIVGYTKNLANSCININSFKSSQRSKKARKIKTHYEIDIQSLTDQAIISQFKSGKSIEGILAPYIPTSPQFAKLLTHYHAMKSSGNTKNLKKVKLNIERTKLMKPADWDTYVLINTPEYKFRMFEDRNKSMEFAVVVGKTRWQTPIFSSELKYIVLNPAWNVPDNIARAEIIPKLVRNPNYLKKRNMVVRRDYNIDSKSIDPSTVDWKLYLTKKYKRKALPYKIIERSSSRNALGTVKFMFPNKFAVYMHDTQAKRLFKRSKRAYSHGCIRLAEPKKLLKHISTNYSSVPFESVTARAKSKKTNYINLRKRIDVRIAYFTAYVNESGRLSFFKDIYGFDKSQIMKGSL